MKNKISKITLEEAITLKKMYELDNEAFFVEIDGNNIKNLSEYLDYISDKLMFPPTPWKNLDGYNDWMSDLDWIGKDKIILLINNFKKFMKDDLHGKKQVMELFQESILPWWEEDVKHFVVEGKPKVFLVFYVD